VTAAPSAVSEFGGAGQYMSRRVLALLTDLIVVTTLIGVAVHHAVAQRYDPNSNEAFFTTLVYTLFALVVYLCVAQAYVGTTLGKALFGLRVQRLEGGRVGIVRAVARNLFLPFDLLLIGLVLAVITPRHRRIGDFVAGTEVVNLRVEPVAPLIAAATLSGWIYLDYAYAGGLATARSLSADIQRYGPGIIAGQSAPEPARGLPARTPVPTEQPITVPTIAPSSTAPPTSAQPPEVPSTAAPATTQSRATTQAPAAT